MQLQGLVGSVQTLATFLISVLRGLRRGSDFPFAAEAESGQQSRDPDQPRSGWVRLVLAFLALRNPKAKAGLTLLAFGSLVIMVSQYWSLVSSKNIHHSLVSIWVFCNTKEWEYSYSADDRSPIMSS